MESLEDVKKLVSEAKNICLIPSEQEPESIPNALALFYTLKELGKNVNLIIQNFPERFNFLVPSLDFISQPKNFVISIPRRAADVSQVYYEKNEDSLKIHLTIDKGNIKKDNISFYFSDAKPDLVITLGILDFQSDLSRRLDSFGFILDTPLVNIDNHQENKKFGKVNIVEQKSISEITLDVVKSIDQNLLEKNVATCLLAGLILHYDNFKSAHTDYRIFEMVSELVKKGALHHQIVNNLYRTTPEQVHFLSEVFKNLQTDENNGLSYAMLNSGTFWDFGESQARVAVEKLKMIGVQDDILVLWPSHSSDPAIKGFFYSKKQPHIYQVAQSQQGAINNDWVFLVVPGEDIALVKESILKSII